MTEIVLFVVEGKKAEPQFLESVKRCFFDGKAIKFITLPNEGTIYQLFSEIDDDQDLDVFPLIKEKFLDGNSDIEKIESRDEISEIYFFFDYDGHATKASDESIKSMLEMFDSETDNGKLYISYPMVEANRHISSEFDFCKLNFKVSEGTDYKRVVDETSDHKFKQVKKLNRECWLELTKAHLSKANFLSRNVSTFPSLNETRLHLDQKNIFNNQLDKYIIPHGLVSVLGSFPFFLVEYFGEKIFDEMVI